ncbi:ADP-ribosylglycohydrolase family protein [Nannocystis sp. SCPEA4]|uniref:ADP-ribosylglycohydrolase family protein n=1 Tax=Nannocystis sp. SCPEA4 TaxID=2996787 RepID=UPI002270EBCE|nr:ADP-ribosylglycohydrolase family protein [Nannocystis sp. SCPEA4]MCY1056048.1 ADP-ribosylglycohydrolase family protein [Nannocystis sp. SCPEA4]
MIAAIAGDIIGSVHERANIKRTDFTLFKSHSRFTDDTVMTLAVADCLLHRRPYAATLRAYGRRYPDRGYGGMFRKWLADHAMGPYQSFGNGSAMRVSPVGFAMRTLDEVMSEARASALPTHDHPEGIKGAQALAVAVFLARRGADKAKIRHEIEDRFGYDLRRTVAAIRPRYAFDVTCQGSVPEAIVAFLDSDDVESAIRLAISLGGDADTLACMAGAVAQAFYKDVPPAIAAEVEKRLTPELWQLTQEFCAHYQVPS